MTNYKEIEDEYTLPIYPKRDAVLVKGKNAKVWDSNGKEYLDCICGHGSVNVGHCNEKVTQAIKEQSQKLVSCPNSFYNDQRAILLQKLLSIAPKNLKKAFLCNSGAESIEAAIKFARITTRRTGFICAMRGFHGRTMGALSATYNEEYKEGFGPFVDGFSFVPFNDFEKLKERADEKTAGIILEIVQGEGGIHIAEEKYLKNIKNLCEEKGILLIIDEVQTGFCRTGKMFACGHFNLEPDLLCLAKSIANGLPMGAVLCSDKIKVQTNKHGTTFGGNPLACAAAIAVIDFMLENHLDKETKEKGDFLFSRLKEALGNSEKVREIRGRGLMVGIELKEKAKPYITELMNEGLLVLPAGSTVIRLLPSLTISHEELEKVVEILKKVLVK